MRYLLAILVSLTVAVPIGQNVHDSLTHSADQIGQALNPEGP